MALFPFPYIYFHFHSHSRDIVIVTAIPMGPMGIPWDPPMGSQLFPIPMHISGTDVHPERFKDVVGVLVNDALSTLPERVDRLVVPPLTQISVFVVLTTCGQTTR